MDSKILESTDSYLTHFLLFGSTSFDSQTNTLVLNVTIDYILSTERFEEHLLCKNLLIRMQLFNPFRTSLGLFHLSVFFVFLFCFVLFFFHFDLLCTFFLYFQTP